MQLFTQRHADKIAGTLSCFDRVVITGGIPGIGYANGMSDHLRTLGIRIFDYTKWATPPREQVRKNAERLSREHRVAIQFLRNRKVRKEDLVSRIVAERGPRLGGYFVGDGKMPVVRAMARQANA